MQCCFEYTILHRRTGIVPPARTIRGRRLRYRHTAIHRKKELIRWKLARAGPVGTMSRPRSGVVDGAETVSCSRHPKVTVSRMTNSIAAAGPAISGSRDRAPAIRRQRQQVKPT